MWDYNVPYQAPIDNKHPVDFVDKDLSDSKVFDSCLGKDCHYVDFLKFFRSEIDHKGVPNVVREYVLKGDERANDIFARMYTGTFTVTTGDLASSLTYLYRSGASYDPSRLRHRVATT